MPEYTIFVDQIPPEIILNGGGNEALWEKHFNNGFFFWGNPKEVLREGALFYADKTGVSINDYGDKADQVVIKNGFPEFNKIVSNTVKDIVAGVELSFSSPDEDKISIKGRRVSGPEYVELIQSLDKKVGRKNEKVEGGIAYIHASFINVPEKDISNLGFPEISKNRDGIDTPNIHLWGGGVQYVLADGKITEPK